MCSAPKPKPIKIEAPEFLRNPFLDEIRSAGGAALAARRGRSALRIPLGVGLGLGFSGQGGTQAVSGTAGPRGNARRAGGATGFSGVSPIASAISGIGGVGAGAGGGAGRTRGGLTLSTSTRLN